MPSKYRIATKNTLWIYARKFKLRRHSHETYKVDLCVSKLYIFHRNLDQRDEIQGLQDHHPKSTNLTMWLHVLKSNMVETTWLLVIDETVNKCEGNHHWCQWIPRYSSTILRMWMNDLKSNIWWNLSIRGQWCKPTIESEETCHWGMQDPRYQKFLSLDSG